MDNTAYSFGTFLLDDIFSSNNNFVNYKARTGLGLVDKIKNLNTDQLVLKAQIHAGGRGKAGGVKLVKKKDIVDEANKLFGKVLVTPQTGPEGRVVKRIYIQK